MRRLAVTKVKKKETTRMAVTKAQTLLRSRKPSQLKLHRRRTKINPLIVQRGQKLTRKNGRRNRQRVKLQKFSSN